MFVSFHTPFVHGRGKENSEFPLSKLFSVSVMQLMPDTRHMFLNHHARLKDKESGNLERQKTGFCSFIIERMESKEIILLSPSPQGRTSLKPFYIKETLLFVKNPRLIFIQ